jgi:hypothetical protein
LAALLLVGLGGTSWWLLKGRGEAIPPALTPAEPTPTPTDAKPTAASARPSGSNPITPGGTVTLPQGGAATGPNQAGTAPAKPEARPEPAAKTKPGPEPKAIDQPELYQPEKLEKLQNHERANLGVVSLSEAIQISESQPDKAIVGFRQALKADPYNANAHAWLAWVLYEQKRLPEFHQQLREARRLNLLNQMSQNPRFKYAYNNARLNQKLPPDWAN